MGAPALHPRRPPPAVRSLCRLRGGAGRAAPGHRSEKPGARRRNPSCPTFGARGSLDTPLCRSAAGSRIGLDARPPARPAAERRAASRHLRPCGLGGADPHAPRGSGTGGLGDPWQRRGARSLVAIARHPRARSLPDRTRRGRGGGGLKAFSELLDRLVFTPRRSVKLRLIQDYFSRAEDPDRGWALAALTGQLSFPGAKPAIIRALVETRADPVLFRWSYDYVGDLAETAALVWPARPEINHEPRLGEVAELLQSASRSEVPGLLEAWLDGLDPAGRWALLKLITGGLRVGVSERLAKTALAEFGGQEVATIEEVWHGLRPPYLELFAWLEGRADPPVVEDSATFRPLMLSHALEETELPQLALEDFVAEWKWDGIRAQLVARNGESRLFSRNGEDIGPSFPDLLSVVDFEAVLDGELLVAIDGHIATFNDLQQRLGRKAPSAKLLREYPAHLRVYDLLFDGGEDLRPLPFIERRRRLERWFDRHRPRRMDLSAIVPITDAEQLIRLRREARDTGVE